MSETLISAAMLELSQSDAVDRLQETQQVDGSSVQNLLYLFSILIFFIISGVVFFSRWKKNENGRLSYLLRLTKRDIFSRLERSINRLPYIVGHRQWVNKFNVFSVSQEDFEIIQLAGVSEVERRLKSLIAEKAASPRWELPKDGIEVVIRFATDLENGKVRVESLDREIYVQRYGTGQRLKSTIQVNQPLASTSDEDLTTNTTTYNVGASDSKTDGFSPVLRYTLTERSNPNIVFDLLTESEYEGEAEFLLGRNLLIEKGYNWNKIDSTAISLSHCLFSFDGLEWTVTGLSSVGTLVDGVLLAPSDEKRLTDRSEIVLGNPQDGHDYPTFEFRSLEVEKSS